LFHEGNARFAENQLAEAAQRYKSALEHWDHPSVRYNLAVCLISLDQPLIALQHLEAALRFGAAALAPEQFTQAQTYRKLLLGQVAELRVSCDTAEAEVHLDGERLLTCVGETTRRLTPGRHQLVATRKGYGTVSKALVLLPGQLTDERLSLAILRPVTITTRRWRPWKPWVVFGAGGLVAVAVGLPLMLHARGAANDYDQAIGQCDPVTGCVESSLPRAVRALPGEARAVSGAAIGMFVASGATLAAGALMAILNIPKTTAKMEQASDTPDHGSLAAERSPDRVAR
jgi:hypothetical protein